MKNKILLVFLALLIISVMLVTIVACGDKKNPDGGGKETPPITDGPVLKLDRAIASLKGGLQGVVNYLGTTDFTEIHGEITLYLDITDMIEAEVTIKGNFSASDESKNNGLLDVKIEQNGTLSSIFTIYIAGDVIYIGEALTQEDFGWIKFEQFKDAKILSHYFAKLPGIITNGLNEEFINDVSDILNYLNLLAQFEEYFSVESADYETELNINFTQEITFLTDELLTGITGLLSAFGLNLNETLTSLATTLGFDPTPILDIVVGAILNETLTNILAGELPDNYGAIAPTIKLSSTVQNNMISDLGIYFNNPTLSILDQDPINFELSAGIRGLSITDTAETISTPSGLNINSVNSAYVEINAKVNIPNLNNGTEVDLTILVNPAIKVQWTDEEKNAVEVDFTGAEAWAHGVITEDSQTYNIYGQYVYNQTLQQHVLAFDLTGLEGFIEGEYEALTSPYYYLGLDLESLFTSSDDSEPLPNVPQEIPSGEVPSEDPLNADDGDEEVDPLSDFDELLDLISKMLDGDSIEIPALLFAAIDVITGNIIPAFDSIKAILDTTVTNTISVNLEDIQNLLDTNADMAFLKDSIYIGEYIDDFIDDPVQVLLDAINGEEGELTRNDLYNVLADVTGLEAFKDYDEKDEDGQKAVDLMISKLALSAIFIRPKTVSDGGIGFGLALYLNPIDSAGSKTDLVSISFTIDIKGDRSYAAAAAAHGKGTAELDATASDLSGYLELTDDEESEYDNNLIDFIIALFEKYVVATEVIEE